MKISKFEGDKQPLNVYVRNRSLFMINFIIKTKIKLTETGKKGKENEESYERKYKKKIKKKMSQTAAQSREVAEFLSGQIEVKTFSSSFYLSINLFICCFLFFDLCFFLFK